ncbi:hypothetical protein COU20_02090 [Candidatus Kaiserbacteria bacterium CG10_big_fil_rev_8_21_14_0_10_59_10]|uniref:DUF1761 domain-containing protein n=1 Tax=Candidatus Kaiserbacteria bacterium CG10_big_fil_rev_8_21_14_0_10_59_10 TaxID=1974612 RepID=A0A2H0U7U4_9BACT|nr:MAG: hypothetical protein COU20_02090 [Candidatus Kaiserbacteria bacterium CG10_big_fil_rev_8_21_14_0_10_59_10]
MYEVTFWPILAAGVASVVLGFLWYHPRIFGTAWMRHANVSPEAAERGKKRMPLTVVVALLASMLIAYVMNHFGIAWGVFDVIGAVELAFWTWVGFAAPVLLGAVLWEQKKFAYFAINAGFWLVAFILMAVILVL